MQFEELKENILGLNSVATVRMQKYLHYKSIRNFVNHFNELLNENSKSKVLNILNGYFEEIQAHDLDFDGYSSTDLARKYVFTIAEYYKTDLNFMRIIKIRHSLFYGVIIDSLLYLDGFLVKLKNIPVFTLGFLLYYFFVVIFKERKGKVYGMFY